MRAALLPFAGDPVLITFWWQFFVDVWADEVDELRAYLCYADAREEYVEYIDNLINPHPKAIFEHKDISGYGWGQKPLTEDTDAEYLVYLEDDAFIYKNGALDEQFRKLEDGTYDIIGSPRISVDMDIHEAQMKKYGLKEEGYDYGANFWPNFFFATKDIIMKTDMHFGGKEWHKGDYIEELDYTVQKETAGADTQSWVSIQLRALTDKIGIIPQYKAYPHIDEQLRQANEWTFSPNAKWIHAGSISSGIMMYLRDEDNVPLGQPSSGPVEIEPLTEDHEKQDFAMRIAWWQIALEQSRDRLQELEGYADKYYLAIERLIYDLGADKDLIENKKKMYEEVMGL